MILGTGSGGDLCFRRKKFVATQSMQFMICGMAAIFSWTMSWSALKMRARSFGPLIAPSHVAMTIRSVSSSSCMLHLKCVWRNPLAGLAVGREGAVARGMGLDGGVAMVLGCHS